MAKKLDPMDVLLNSYLVTTELTVYRTEKEKIQFAMHDHCKPNPEREQVDRPVPEGFEDIAQFKKVDEVMQRVVKMGVNELRIDPVRLIVMAPRLGTQGTKLLFVLFHKVFTNGVIQKDKKGAWDGYVDLHFDVIDENYKEYKFTKKTLYEGIAELKKEDILRKVEGKPGYYWYDFTFCSRSSVKTLWNKFFDRLTKIKLPDSFKDYVTSMWNKYRVNRRKMQYKEINKQTRSKTD